MKAKINIELWEDGDIEAMKELGITNKLLENIFKMAFEKLCLEITSDGGHYSVNVEIVEGIE